MNYKNYTHLKCECGGIIGMYDKEHFTCEKCKKVHLIGNQGTKWDVLLTNEKNGWIFPMIRRKNKVIPERMWVEDIVNECRKANIPVFMKSSLSDIWGEELIQEYPDELNHKKVN